MYIRNVIEIPLATIYAGLVLETTAERDRRSKKQE
jgi:hypothetical protein